MSDDSTVSASRPAKDKSHHHGNLREALIEAGLTLLAREGTEGLTLRKCAALAGVSHAAPAHHFGGLPGLLAAIAARGFTIFAGTMREHARVAEDDPHARLVAICKGYYAFAMDNPALFDLMFRQIWSVFSVETPELSAAGADAYGVLAQACAPFVAPGQPPEVVETQVWGLIHGYATLELAGKLGHGRPRAPLDAVLALLPSTPLAPGG